MNRTLLDDDKALEIIELTLYKYQGFLDFLRNAGFGKLIEMGDMNQKHQSSLNNENNLRNQAKNKSKPSNAASSSNSNRHQTSPSKLTDQQKYYLEKINKTKSKMVKNALESTKNSSIINDHRSKYTDNIEGFINYDMIDKSLINGQDGAENHHIDTLVRN
jgi:hypothetical protein